MKKLKLLGKKSLVLGALISVILLATLSLLHLTNNKAALSALLGLCLVLIIWLLQSIKVNFLRLKKIAELVDGGMLPAQEDIHFIPEITNPITSMHHKMQEVIAFVKALGDKSFSFNHINPEGTIGTMLISLSEQQSKIAEEEKRRNWKNEGLAKFSELLHADDKDLKELSAAILINLVNYLGANQGGFYIADQSRKGDQYMEMTACYAYNRQKKLKKRIEKGEGLLGQVMLEKDLLFLTDIPEDYVNITSGLGEATPKNVVIIPLRLKGDFFGAIEIASFNILEEYQIAFIKELAEIIAITVSAVKTNENTRKLLQESRDMAEALQSQEEGMMQNMMELQTTQEEMERGKLEIDGLFSAINNAQGLVEFDTSGAILKANDRIKSTVGLSLEELKSEPRKLLSLNNKRLWSALKDGTNYETEFEITAKSGNITWLNANYSPVKDADGKLIKILALFLNITARKEKEKEFQRLSLVADNTNNSVIITDAKGLVEYVNPGFTRLTKYTFEEMLGKKPGDILQGKNTDEDAIQRIGEKIKAEESLYEEILNYDKEGNSYWVSIAINPVKNEAGEVEKYISVQANITETKISALDYKNKLEAIDRSNAVIEFDVEGNITEVNDNFLDIVKYKKEELIGKHHRIFIPKEEADTPAYHKLWSDLRSGIFINREFRRIDRNGNEIWLRGIYNPIFDIDNNPIKIVKYATDITKEKALHIETEHQRKELSSHLETLNKTIATIELDSNAIITDANKVYLDISGYELKDIKGKSYDTLLAEEESKKPQNEMMWKSLLAGHFFSGQFKQQSKEGKDLWLLGTFNPVLDDNENVDSIKMFAQFNTLEKEREINNTQLLNAFKSTMPVIELNADGVCVKANTIFHDEFGISRMEIRNKYISDLFETDITEKQLNEILQKITKDQVIEEIISYVSDEGNIKLFRAVFHPIKNSRNEITKILMVLIEKEMIVKIEAK